MHRDEAIESAAPAQERSGSQPLTVPERDATYSQMSPDQTEAFPVNACLMVRPVSSASLRMSGLSLSHQVARVMTNKGLRRLMVINHNHATVGIVSVDDLARCSHDLAGKVLEAVAPWPH